MSLYDTLNIKQDASIKEIRSSYLKLAKIYHPDKCKDINAHIKFENINTAYNILINEKSRNEYNLMNINKKEEFNDFLYNIFQNSINFNNLSNFGIKLKDINCSENFKDFLDQFNVFDLMNLFTKNIVPKKDYSSKNDCSDSDVNLWDETMAEYYKCNQLPLLYQRFNKNNIMLSLDLKLEDLINPKIRKIKINRKIENKKTLTSFNFLTTHHYIVYNQGGDIDDESNGSLIIKLNLPNEYYWDDNIIYYNFNITLYQYIYGLNLKLNILDKEIDIKEWVPYRDGNIIPYDIKLNEYNFAIYFKIILENINKEVLKKYFG